MDNEHRRTWGQRVSRERVQAEHNEAAKNLRADNGFVKTVKWGAAIIVGLSPLAIGGFYASNISDETKGLREEAAQAQVLDTEDSGYDADAMRTSIEQITEAQNEYLRTEIGFTDSFEIQQKLEDIFGETAGEADPALPWFLPGAPTDSLEWRAEGVSDDGVIQWSLRDEKDTVLGFSQAVYSPASEEFTSFMTGTTAAGDTYLVETGEEQEGEDQ